MDNKQINKFIEQLRNIDTELNNTDLDSFDKKIFEKINNVVNNIGDEIKTNVNTNDELGLVVKVKKFHPDAIVPGYAKHGDAGLDLTAVKIINENDSQITYGIGLGFEVPFGYVGLVFPRSSIRNYELTLSNSVGCIDSGYRGEIECTFIKTKGRDSFKYNIGDRVCQLIIIPFPHIKFNVVDELSNSERGTGGFGSSGI